MDSDNIWIAASFPSLDWMIFRCFVSSAILGVQVSIPRSLPSCLSHIHNCDCLRIMSHTCASKVGHRGGRAPAFSHTNSAVHGKVDQRVSSGQLICIKWPWPAKDFPRHFVALLAAAHQAPCWEHLGEKQDAEGPRSASCTCARILHPFPGIYACFASCTCSPHPPPRKLLP